MSRCPVALPATATVATAARAMRHFDIGDVLVLDGHTLLGIVTDRDIVARVLAVGLDPAATSLDEIVSREMTTVAPEAPVVSALRLMRDLAIRRLPVVKDGSRPIGILSIGDLALYRELERKGLRHFRPRCYLTDEWGCPDGEPIIGIPFYLADPKLTRLEQEIDDVEDARAIRMYLRHEAGHAFNYAYRLQVTPEWREIFGPFNRPYRERYRPVPFDRNFVRHLEGWYAQKHPDEDFAETFAVWLTPGSRWRQRYRGWPAMRKLRYVARMVREMGGKEPLVRLASTDITVEEMDMTVEEFFQRQAPTGPPVDVALEDDLPDFFLRPGRRRRVRPAADMVREHRVDLVNKIEYWTGVPRGVVRALVDRIAETVSRLRLLVDTRRESATLVGLTTYATTLAMNYLARGSFVPRARRALRASTARNDGRRRDG